MQDTQSTPYYEVVEKLEDLKQDAVRIKNDFLSYLIAMAIEEVRMEAYFSEEQTVRKII